MFEAESLRPIAPHPEGLRLRAIEGIRTRFQLHAQMYQLPGDPPFRETKTRKDGTAIPVISTDIFNHGTFLLRQTTSNTTAHSPKFLGIRAPISLPLKRSLKLAKAITLHPHGQ